MKSRLVTLAYAVSVLASVGIASSAYSMLTFDVDWSAENTRISQTNRALLRSARAGNKFPEQWKYKGEDVRWFWEQFAKVNLTGRVSAPPPALVTGDDTADEPAELDLDDALELACIMSAGDNTGVLLRYLQAVEVPLKFQVPAAPPRDTIPRGRRALVGAAPRDPVHVSPTIPLHHMQIGESLWAPLDYVFLTRVAEDAASVEFEFRRDADKDEKGRYRTQIVQRAHLDAPEFGVVGRTGAAATGARSSGPGGHSPAGNGETLDWSDLPAPALTAKGHRKILPQHMDYLSRGAVQDVALRDFSHGGIRGVEIRNVSATAKRLGFFAGDVITSINGIAVTGMAQAKKVGTRLYSHRGVRAFRIEVMRRGRTHVLNYDVEADSAR